MNQMPRRIGHYELQDELGYSDLYVVYFARNTSTDQWVALKLLGSRFDGNSAAREKFMSVGEQAAVYKHRNVVTIFETGEIDGRPFIAMEYLHGMTLQRWLDQVSNTVAPSETVEIVTQIADGLDHVHQRNGIHGGINPRNIFITEDSRAVLCDFGVIEASLAACDGDFTLVYPEVDDLAYCSPEQIRGDRLLDARTDTYSLGVVAYRMLTGTLPFDAVDANAMIRAVSDELPIAPESASAMVSPGVAYVLRSVLAKQPSVRYGTSGELAIALKEGQLWSRDGDAGSTTAGGFGSVSADGNRPTRRRLPAFIGLLFMLIVVAMAALFAVQPDFRRLLIERSGVVTVFPDLVAFDPVDQKEEASPTSTSISDPETVDSDSAQAEAGVSSQNDGDDTRVAMGVDSEEDTALSSSNVITETLSSSENVTRTGNVESIISLTQTPTSSPSPLPTSSPTLTKTPRSTSTPNSESDEDSKAGDAAKVALLSSAASEKDAGGNVSAETRETITKAVESAQILVPTDTAIPATATKSDTPTATMTPLPTKTPTPKPTATVTKTPIPPTATKTETPVPTKTFTPPPTRTATKTNTPMPPTATATSTPKFTSTPRPTSKPTLTPTKTPKPTSTMTRVPPTATKISTPAPTSTVISTSTKRPTSTLRPTSTATQRPTSTSRPTSTATQRPTSTSRPTSTATQRPTSTSRPTSTVTQRPTSTSRPTSTATQRPTLTATKTRTPLPTATPVPPTSTPLPTATLAPPTQTSTPTLPPTSTPIALDSVALELLTPGDGTSSGGDQVFEWRTTIAPAEGQAFELVFWPVGTDPIGRGFGLASPTTGNRISVDLIDLDARLGDLLGPGDYSWGLILVQTDPYQRIQFLGQQRRFQYVRDSSSSGTGGGPSSGE